MENELIPLSSEVDDQFRSALRWMIRLQQNGDDADTSRDFAAWLEESAAHQHAFARCESLWQTVQLALARLAD